MRSDSRLPTLLLLTLLSLPLPRLAAAQSATEPGAKEEAAAHTEELAPVIIEEGRVENLVAVAETASQGKIGRSELETRPILRTGELLETVPGLIVTQHSGTGKANQYFLRGFNLDHGTDFRTDVDGMPVNMPSHGHGQGYSDINFIIPELVHHIDYKKGVYYAEEGDFSSAGAADFSLESELTQGIAKLEAGTDSYFRSVTADSAKLGPGTLLLGLELQYYDGPWELDEDFQKYNAMVRYTWGDKRESFSITGLAYRSLWNSTDQIPERAVESGLIDRLGNLDPTDGGRTERYSLSTSWKQKNQADEHSVSAYVISYGLNLFSNFTYFLDDPDSGDQFEQVDRRTVIGGETGHEYFGTLFGSESSTKLGVQVRSDTSPKVALYRTRQRERLTTTRNDKVDEATAGLYVKNETRWTDKFRSILGARGDIFYFHVDSDTSLNTGNEWEGKVSPKGSLVFGPWSGTELYVSGGLGFHSNDARGTTITVDPSSGEPAESVDPLVLSRGAEAGIRTAFTENLQSTIAFWALDLSSELLFVGDAGSTEASRESRRYGVELANYYRPVPWLSLEADYSVSHARFRDDDEAGDYIPGSVESVVSAGITAGEQTGPFGTIRLRYFGPRPLIEDNSVESDSTTLVNAQAGYRVGNLQVALEALNLLDSNDHDIDYFYESRLPGEPDEGIQDIHFHPVEPLQLRAAITYRF